MDGPASVPHRRVVVCRRCGWTRRRPFFERFPPHQPGHDRRRHARRGGRSGAARSPRSAAATFGLQRLSLTQLAARRAAIVALARDGVAPSTWLGAEAVATRAAFDATRDGVAALLRAGRDGARVPARARAHAAGAARWPACRAAALARLPLAGPDLAHLLDRFEDVLRRRRDRRSRAICSRPPRDADQRARRSPAPSLLLDVPIESCRSEARSSPPLVAGAAAVLRDGAAAAIATRCSALGGDGRRRVERRPAATDAGRPGLSPPISCSTPRSSRPMRGAGRLARVLLRAGRGARVRGDRAPRARGSARAASASTRWRSSSARRAATSACSSTRSDAPRCRPGSIAARGGRIRPAARFSRCSRAPPSTCRRRGSRSTCRSARCRSRHGDPHDRVGARRATRRSAARRTCPTTSSRPRRGRTRREPADDDAAVVAGTLRAPWRWERLLVDAAVIGSDAARWARRLDGLARPSCERQLRRGGARGRAGQRRVPRPRA